MPWWLGVAIWAAAIIFILLFLKGGTDDDN